MRFIAEGPDIPDDLLIARDRGDVIFFCGAGVSQAKANLPNFSRLAHAVVDGLGSSIESSARKVLEIAEGLETVSGVGGLVATDRIFGLLEREFEVDQIRQAVCEAIRPAPAVDLTAHRILLDLATANNVTRLVTTNFDLLFEACDPSLRSSGPPYLPDPRSERNFRGIVHLHGRVNAAYSDAEDDEFVVSSADFGRAYLSDGWATRFIQSLLARYQIVFLGYSADDPPVQYLLESLNLRGVSRPRLYAFQTGDKQEAVAQWEHRGVQAIPFDPKADFAPLWDTLTAWAERARNPDRWYEALFARAGAGPAELEPHERGQLAHVASTLEGAKRLSEREPALDASWLLAFDADDRYATPFRVYDGNEPVDPFRYLGFDSDEPPAPPKSPDNPYESRAKPKEALDVFAVTRADLETLADQEVLSGIRGGGQDEVPMPVRLRHLSTWLLRVAHQPVTLWWAASGRPLHPRIRRALSHQLDHTVGRFEPDIAEGWRLLLAAWTDLRINSDGAGFDVEARVEANGWSEATLREYVAIFRPQLKVDRGFNLPHPSLWTPEARPEHVVRTDIDYPAPHSRLDIPVDLLPYAISEFRRDLELAVSLETEAAGMPWAYIETTLDDDFSPRPEEELLSLTAPVLRFQALVGRLANIDPALARVEALGWRRDDKAVFTRLRLWAASQSFLTGDDAGAVFTELSDELFWHSLHERELLFALSTRWKDLSPAIRRRLETRLRTGAFNWGPDTRRGPEAAAAFDRLNRVHWLITHGVTFGFDVPAFMAAQRALAPDWTEAAGDHAADSNAVRAYDIEQDDDERPLLETPLSEILNRAAALQDRDIFERVQREPFRGLVKRRPARALAALTSVQRRRGESPQAWATFLQSEARSGDKPRLICATLVRLLRLPDDQFAAITYPIANWLEAVRSYLFADGGGGFTELWDRLMDALSKAEVDRRPSGNGSWADIALNSAVGRLVNLIMQDPAKDNLEPDAGLPELWRSRADKLLNLPGTQRPQALVMLAFNTPWFFNVDPAWAERALVSSAGAEGDDGAAFWDGFYWANRNPGGPLFARLKAAIIGRARALPDSRPRNNSLSRILLSAWLRGGLDAAEPAEGLSDQEVREILVHADDQVRGQFIWHLERLLTAEDGKWRDRVLDFLRSVWPKQRSLRTPFVSHRLANFALSSGDLFPEVVAILLPFLVPIREMALRGLSTAPKENGLATRFPKAMLDLLWVILGDDASQWPFRIEETLQVLEDHPDTKGDGRLAELRRRRAQ